MQRDLAVQSAKQRPYEVEYSVRGGLGAGASRISQTPVLETPPAVSQGVVHDYTYVTKYTF